MYSKTLIYGLTFIKIIKTTINYTKAALKRLVLIYDLMQN